MKRKNASDASFDRMIESYRSSVTEQNRAQQKEQNKMAGASRVRRRGGGGWVEAAEIKPRWGDGVGMEPR
jgi:hypothetical protein